MNAAVSDAVSDQPAATVAALHIAPGSRLEMKSRAEVEIRTGGGIVGDRYENSRHRHVTVQSSTQLAQAAERLGAPIDPAGTRRNITISTGDVPLKPGTRWSIGGVELEVVRVAAPCKLLEDDLGPGARRALSGLAGVVCRVLTGGPVALGDPVEWPDQRT